HDPRAAAPGAGEGRGLGRGRDRGARVRGVAGRPGGAHPAARGAQHLGADRAHPGRQERARGLSVDERTLLRHLLAVLAYRGAKPLRDAPDSFASYDTGGGHTPLVILSHVSDLMDWALSHAQGAGRWPKT